MKKAKILLLIPPVVYKRQPNIGVAYLLSYLKNLGYDAVVWDLSLEVSNINDGDDGYWGQNKNGDLFIEEHKTLFDEWINRILEYGADIIGFNVWATSKRQCLYLANKIKERAPEKLIIFGGPEAVLADNLFLGEEAVDILVRGEGEEALAEIIDKFQDNGKVEFCKGCYVRVDRQMVDCGKREEIKNLDELPFPDFSSFPLDKYLYKGHIPISFSRGCKWRCSFCTVENCWSKYRSRSVENIFREIKKRLKELYIEQFVVCDPAVNQDLPLLSSLADLIILDGLNIKWDGMAQIKPGMDPGFLKKIRKSGCVLLNYGVESGVDSMLVSMGKRYSSEEARRVIKDTYEAGIDVVLNFIVGYPNETEDDFYRNLDFIKSIRKYVLNIAPGHPCLVVPYNKLYKYPEKYGIKFDGMDLANWKTVDGNNTLAVRERRSEIFNEFLESYDVPIRCGDDDREIIEKEESGLNINE